MTQQQAQPSFSPEQEITSKEEVEQAVEYLIEKYDLDIEYKLDVSSRFKRLNGQYKHSTKEIRIAQKILDEKPERAFEIIRHEVGHAVAVQRYGGNIDPHGEKWKQVMAELGVDNPKTGHKFDFDDYNYVLYCTEESCDYQSYYYRKSKAIKQPELYLCPDCSSTLKSREYSSESTFELAQERDFKEVELNKIELKDSLRKEYDNEEIERKANSIRQEGLIQPIEAMETEDGYEIVSGAYRYFAFQKLDRDTIPAFVVEDLDDIDRKARGLAENLIREDMKPSEKIIRTAEILDHLKNNMENNSPGEVGAQQKFAERFGVSESTVSKWKVIHEYWKPEEELEAKRLDEGKLSMGDLHEICKERKKREKSDDDEEETMWSDDDGDGESEDDDDGDDENNSDEGSQVFRKLKKWVSPPTDDVDKLSESKLTELRKEMDKQVLPMYKETLSRSKITEEEAEQIRQQIGEIQDALDKKV